MLLLQFYLTESIEKSQFVYLGRKTPMKSLRSEDKQRLQQQTETIQEQSAHLQSLKGSIRQQLKQTSKIECCIEDCTNSLSRKLGSGSAISQLIKLHDYLDNLGGRLAETRSQIKRHDQTLKEVQWQLDHTGECSSDSDLDVSIEMEDDKKTPASTQSGANSDCEDEPRMMSSSAVFVSSRGFVLPLNHSQYFLNRVLTKEQVMEALSQAEEMTKDGFVREVESGDLVAKALRVVKHANKREGLIKGLLREGINILPFKTREEVWPILIGDHLYITEDYYELIRKRSSKVDGLTRKTIECDLNRTYPHIELFEKDSTLWCELKQMLEMMATIAQFGYVQGMAYPASIFLLTMGKKWAFSSLANLLICHQFFHKLYSFDEVDYRLKNKVFDFIIKKYVPKVWKHLHKSTISPQLLLVQWFFSIFGRAFQLDVVMKIWDLILIEGEAVMYSMSVAILKLCEKQVLQVLPDESYCVIKSLSKKLLFQQLYQMHRKVDFTNDQYHDTIRQFI